MSRHTNGGRPWPRTGRRTAPAAAPRLTFLGAAQNVTGSRYLLEAGGSRILVDCGLYQERDLLARNWDPFPVPPASIDTLLLTHAHVDHCGYLPRLVHDGFHGRIVSTPVTAEIAAIILTDSAKIQVEDAAYKKKRHAREKRTGPHPEVPLYTLDDVAATLPLFDPVAYSTPVPIGDGLTAEFRDAGHILGSSSVLVGIGTGAARRTMLFSGDVGRWDKPLLNDPVAAAGADWIVVESTYGDRLHEQTGQIREHLAAVITETRRRGGNIIVPSFALERTQEVLWYLNDLIGLEAHPAPAGLRRQPDGGARDGRLREAPGDPRRADARADGESRLPVPLLGAQAGPHRAAVQGDQP